MIRFHFKRIVLIIALILMPLLVFNIDTGQCSKPPKIHPINSQPVVLPIPAELHDDPGLIHNRNQFLNPLLIGENTVSISIGEGLEAASETDHLVLMFKHRPIWLMGIFEGFPEGMTLLYDLSGLDDFFQSVHIDDWDNQVLAIESEDNLTIAAIRIVHSGQTILDWSGESTIVSSVPSRWNLTQEILAYKLMLNPDFINGITFWALQETGKNDGTKYSEESPGGWCSEYTAWCLRHHGWNTPTGSIGSQHMRAFFDSYDRLFTIEQIYNGEYIILPGDYISMNNQSHSGLFLGYIDAPENPGPETEVLTIEGGGIVSIRTNHLGMFDHIGCAQ